MLHVSLHVLKSFEVNQTNIMSLFTDSLLLWAETWPLSQWELNQIRE